MPVANDVNNVSSITLHRARCRPSALIVSGTCHRLCPGDLRPHRPASDYGTDLNALIGPPRRRTAAGGCGVRR
jgi:hypothetical protein